MEGRRDGGTLQNFNSSPRLNGGERKSEGERERENNLEREREKRKRERKEKEREKGPS